MVATPNVEPTPVSTADYVSLDLPSKFAYYPFKDLYIKPFRTPHLAKLAKADARNSLQLLAELVSSVLMTPSGDTNIAFKLSITDLNAVMYWLRMNSFAKHTISVKSECEGHEHREAVQKGTMDKESLIITTMFQETDINVRYLESMPDPEEYKIILRDDKIGERVVRMRPETVADSIQFLDHPDFMDEELQYKTKILSVLDLPSAFPEINWTLDQKLAFYDEGILSMEDVMLAQKFGDLMDSIGIQEIVKTKCGKCGASGTALLSFDAASFLSPNF
jgi:hypothetical protein